MMSVKNITAADLKLMTECEGLILQGCGGEVQEWIDGINEMLTEESILLNDTKFSNVASFQNDGLTCLLFKFDNDIKIDMGKLAIWRLKTHSDFGGTWLSDYVPNKLGGFGEVQEASEELNDSLNMDL